MEYQVCYLSPLGHTRKLADAFIDILPDDAVIVDLSTEDAEIAPYNIVGFEMNEGNFKAVPYRIMEALDQLENTAVALYVTCPFQVDKTTQDQMERAILPFLPESCDYRGLWMCSGEGSKAFITHLEKLADQRPEDESIRNMLNRAKAAVGHPNEQDIIGGYNFIEDAF